MKLIVVGGQTRNIGKTSVMAGLIRDLKSFAWTAVKITQHGNGIHSNDGEPSECVPAGQAFVLAEEANPRGRADTCRFLGAGARRSLWLRVREGQLATALPTLSQALSGDEHVIIESNSILGFLKPTAYLVVLDRARRDFKTSARQFVERADALVHVGAGPGVRTWPDLDSAILRRKRVFPVSPPSYATPELCLFVQQRLGGTILQ